MFFVFLWPEKMTYMDYKIYQLPNGLRLIHKQENTPVCYCGMVVDAGSRDELPQEHGLAHLVEHLMFKGTLKRRSGHIINCLENVGGELNAFTSKEETVVYAAVLSEHLEKAVDLIGDIIFNSVFPEKEIEKEKIVIIDEIQSYNDSPSELIYDDFEELLFHEHPLGHNILGDEALLNSFSQNDLKRFTQRLYTPETMVFYVVGKADEKKLLRWAEKYFVNRNDIVSKSVRKAPASYTSTRKKIKKDTFQVHQMIGNLAYNLHHSDRLSMYLLNNILGGPGMNSLLNLSLREKHGLVYTVDSVYQPFTDTGAWMIYYGCDEKNLPKCERLVKNVLNRLCDEKIADKQVNKYKLQLLGQMAIASENRENLGVSMGKSLLRYGKVDTLGSVKNMIMEINADKLREVAGIAFNEKQLTSLTYL
jgi:predicted Zn-dependent peptidase